MASNKKITHQQKRPKTNCFLTCFGFSTKPSSSSKKKNKPKKIETRKKLFKVKLRWPKLIKVITIEKRRFSFDDAKAATLKTSQDIIREATKAHQQLKRIDNHHVSNLVKEPKVTSKRMNISQEKQSLLKNQLQCATCYKEDHHHKVAGAVLKRSSSSSTNNKVVNDSLFGVAIMISMLVIMSIWGRLCAILCMSAWLYCVPLLRGNKDVATTPRNYTSNDMGKTDNNLNLELYKKKVVLQGLLQRDHKNAIGIS